jgi:hypothetical protein
MAALHEAAKRLQSQMEDAYLQQRRFKHGALDEPEEKRSKTGNKH